ncbi:MAG: hypothetical protein FJY60_04475 [Betaproteobacteria bacterium]|nr:hypothetical protein [Betaproteobacteria bacterium]
MIDTAPEVSNDTVSSEGIFLRTADRRRFDYVMQAVQQQSLSLSLSSSHDGVLDHYGRIVINKLRKMPDLQIEVFLPQNTEALLDRFNQILGGLSLDDARNGDNSPAPRRVLIAHDAKAISARDLQLLARLVQDFPGANVSLILLMDRTGIAQHEKNLDNFGQRLLRWPLEQPTRAEGESLLTVARAMGFEVEVKKVLAATGFAEVKIPQPVEEPVGYERERSDAKTRKNLPAQKPQQTSSASDDEQEALEPVSVFSESPQRPLLNPALKTVLGWTLAFVLLLSVAVGTIMLLFPERLAPMLANSPTLKQNLPAWLMTVVAQVASKPATAQPEAKPDSATAADAKTSVPAPAADSSANKSETGAAKPSPVADVVRPTETAASAANAANTSTTKAAAEDPLAPRSERGVDQMIREVATGSFFVQHVAVKSMAEAQELRAAYPALSGAKIAAVKSAKKGVRYILISGPFADRKEARAFLRKDGIPADSWLRPVKPLQRELQPANR